MDRKITNEELLEPLARYIRFRAGIGEIQCNHPVRLIDIGCGPKICFYDFARQHHIAIKQYIGIDPLLANYTIKHMAHQPNIRLLRRSLNSTLPLPDSSVEYVVGFAFLEHVDQPQKVIDESVRILKINGKAIFTTPSHSAKALLEFLSSRLGLISTKGVAEHKTYFDKQTLLEMMKKHQPSVHVTHRYFEIGLNNLLVIKKIR